MKSACSQSRTQTDLQQPASQRGRAHYSLYKRVLLHPVYKHMIYLWPFKRKCQISTRDKVRTRAADGASLHTDDIKKKQKKQHTCLFTTPHKKLCHHSFSLVLILINFLLGVWRSLQTLYITTLVSRK